MPELKWLSLNVFYLMHAVYVHTFDLNQPHTVPIQTGRGRCSKRSHTAVLHCLYAYKVHADRRIEQNEVISLLLFLLMSSLRLGEGNDL